MLFYSAKPGGQGYICGQSNASITEYLAIYERRAEAQLYCARPGGGAAAGRMRCLAGIHF
jgi:hypothetical protein